MSGAVHSAFAPPALPSKTDEGRRVHLRVVQPVEREHGRRSSLKRISKRELARGAEMYPVDPELESLRPKTLADCERMGLGTETPCPWVSCRHNLFLDVSETTGAVKLNHPNIEPHEMTESCALAVADRGGATLEEVGEITNLTHVRISQLETESLAKLREAAETMVLREFAAMLDEAVEPWRRNGRVGEE